MFVRKLQSSLGEFLFSIESPRQIEGDWITTLKIESPVEKMINLPCYGVDALDAILYAVKLAAINVQVFKQEGVDLQWLNDEDCGFDYATPP